MEKEIPESERRIGVLGAGSPVGRHLAEDPAWSGFEIIAFSRSPSRYSESRVRWLNISALKDMKPPGLSEPVPFWISLMPLWLLPECLGPMKNAGMRRLVALGSTSRITKERSSFSGERILAARLADAESAVLEWAGKNRVHTVLLLPTLIYGNGMDANVASIARFVRRFGFFPVAGAARGLRQPVHAQDVARACHAALFRPGLKSSYILSGGETLPFREMVRRIFLALNRPARFVQIPLPLFRLAAVIGRLLGMDIPAGAGERMNQDLVFEHRDAGNDLDFRPRKFVPSPIDVS